MSFLAAAFRVERLVAALTAWSCGGEGEVPLGLPAPAAHRLMPDNGTIVEGACVPRGGDYARHIQGFTKVPRHIPRLAFRASFSAST